MHIIAHRANVDGPDHFQENSLRRTRFCIDRGWSVETDIRRDEVGRFYVSHDPAPWSPDNAAEAFCAEWRRSPIPVALNIKELGYEDALIDFFRAQDVLSHVFLFDMELLEKQPGYTARHFRDLDTHVALGARVSDRQEPITRALTIECAKVIWLDEFDTHWATTSDVQALQNAGRIVYAVSPELHGRSKMHMRERWEQLISWGVNGFCTDFPMELEHVVNAMGASTSMGMTL